MDPLPGQILAYRTLAKLKSTYADTLPEMIHPKTGRIHTSFHQAVTATGRLSSNHPNLQNIPIRGEDGRRIRSCFVPRPGNVFLSCDYSQVELRVLAHYCKTGPLVEAFGKIKIFTSERHRRYSDCRLSKSVPISGVLPNNQLRNCLRNERVSIIQ